MSETKHKTFVINVGTWVVMNKINLLGCNKFLIDFGDASLKFGSCLFERKKVVNITLEGMEN